MVDSIPNPAGPSPAGPGPAPDPAKPGVGGVPGARSDDAQRTGAAGGAQFQSLLEQIETRARELAAATDAVQAPDQLAGAVDSARESLENVLDLKERLLEAYRQQQQQGGPPDSTAGPGAGAS